MAFFTHFLWFKMIRDNPQVKRIFFNGFFTHFLRLTYLIFLVPRMTKFQHLLLLIHFFISAYQMVKKNFFCLFFLVFRHTSIHHTIRMPSNRQELFLNLCFRCLAFLITFIPLNKFITIMPIIVLVP